jgi:hypothetical protein
MMPILVFCLLDSGDARKKSCIHSASMIRMGTKLPNEHHESPKRISNDKQIRWAIVE